MTFFLGKLPTSSVVKRSPTTFTSTTKTLATTATATHIRTTYHNHDCAYAADHNDTTTDDDSHDCAYANHDHNQTDQEPVDDNNARAN